MGGLLDRIVRIYSKRIAGFELCRAAVEGKRGIEIGGPSQIFKAKGEVPVYPLVGTLDGCNFAAQTLWRNDITEGATYEWAPGKPKGHQYVCEAGDLAQVESGRYDFLLASHVIEHMANPLGALAEWARVVREGGALLVVVPHYEGTFDHKRKVTTLDHLIVDQTRAVGEDDKTHLEEWIAGVDLERAPETGGMAKFRERSLANLENRGMHHHVFDTDLVVRMIDRAGLQIEVVDHARPMHVVVLARRSSSPDNARFLAPGARHRKTTPFMTDRR